MIDIFKLPVFGPADLLPMMNDGRLTDLAEDIDQNGLRHPLVVADIPDKNDSSITTLMLIDGRNRRAACKLAGTEPEWVHLGADEDPLAFVHSMDNRRDITTGQRAMLYACRFPKATTRKQQGRGHKLPGSGEISTQRVADARKVLVNKLDQDLVDAVLLGVTRLDAAVKKAKTRSWSRDEDADNLAGLREHHPDLADLVADDTLTFDEAQAAAEEREKHESELLLLYGRALEGAVHRIRSPSPSPA